jgi:hypothetical protein
MIALVTGASSGIGLEFAWVLAEEGYDLVLVARRADELSRVATAIRERYGVATHCRPSDLVAPGAAANLWASLTSDALAIDVLINNAGTAIYGALSSQDPGELAQMLELNVVALTTLTRLAVSSMLARGSGRILNVASVSGYQPGGPGMAAYYASKAYVVAFSRGIARELRGTGVSVTLLAPGATHTPFEERSGMGRTRLYRWFPKSSARDVARAGYRSLMKRSMVCIPGLLAKAMAIGGEIPPRRIALEVNRLLLENA